jgi:hypothetical protein
MIVEVDTGGGISDDVVRVEVVVVVVVVVESDMYVQDQYIKNRRERLGGGNHGMRAMDWWTWAGLGREMFLPEGLAIFCSRNYGRRGKALP